MSKNKTRTKIENRLIKRNKNWKFLLCWQILLLCRFDHGLCSEIALLYYSSLNTFPFYDISPKLNDHPKLFQQRFTNWKTFNICSNFLDSALNRFWTQKAISLESGTFLHSPLACCLVTISSLWNPRKKIQEKNRMSLHFSWTTQLLSRMLTETFLNAGRDNCNHLDPNMFSRISTQAHGRKQNKQHA